MFIHGVVNQFDNLITSDPAVGMEHQVKYTLFMNGGIERELPIPDGIRIVRFLDVLS